MFHPLLRLLAGVLHRTLTLVRLLNALLCPVSVSLTLVFPSQARSVYSPSGLYHWLM
jgi:hypothetical protein